MNKKTIDEILRDGKEITLLAHFSNSSLMGMKKINHGIKSEFDINTYYQNLEENWKELKKLELKYPDSEFLKEKMKEVKEDSKGTLPEEIYNQIYENGK